MSLGFVEETKGLMRSKTTLDYWMVVERCLNLKEKVGGSIPGCEIPSLLDIRRGGQ